jgi:hypothetical protein
LKGANVKMNYNITTYKKELIAIFLVVLVLFIGVNAALNGVTAGKNEKSGYVDRVIDGDTIVVKNVGKVRLVGVDTPEIGKKGSVAATNYVKTKILGKYVTLDIDNKKQKDRYGRILAVVYVNGFNLNYGLLKKHYAKIMYIPPSEFKKGYPGKIIKTSATPKSVGSKYKLVGSVNSNIYHKSSCSSAKKIKSYNLITFKSIADAKAHGYRACKKEW